MRAGAVIVGAGIAGVSAAFALREAGYAGGITLVGDEPHPPYERPPLSKAALEGEDGAEGATPRALRAVADYEAAGITLLAGPGARHLDPQARELVLGDDRVLPYERLLLATGASPRRLSVPGADGPLFHLRTPEDAAALRGALRPSCRVAIVGGGLIGLEVAAAARQRGASVTIFEAAPRALHRGVPHALAELLLDEHRRHGVTLHVGAVLAEIAWSDELATLRFADGLEQRADVVVVAIGVVPRVALAEAAGLAVGNGILADACLNCGDAIFGAGDCLAFEHPLFGRRLRLESWDAAADLGAVAGRNMAGPPQPVGFAPWMWSDQYGLGLYMAGLPEAGVETVARHAPGGPTLLFHLDAGGRLVGASGVGQGSAAARDLKLARRLIAQRAAPAPDRLADPRQSLKSLLLREPLATQDAP
jgi:3-phenylpropionate/trans-cinnamate dioxygenase ferredoxin reductase subunit